MESIIKFLTSKELYVSIFVIMVSFIVYFLAKRIILKVLERNKNDGNHKKRVTYVKLLKNIVKYAVVLLCIFIVLQINGVDVSSIFVSLGVVSLVAGLSLQDALKDIIMGFNIIADNYFSVGDIIEINGLRCKVIEIGLKASRLEELATGNVLVIANRGIDKALNISNQVIISIPSPYEKSVKDIENVLNKILKEINKLEHVNETSYIGITEYADSSIIYKIKIITDAPDNNGPVKVSSLKIIKNEYDKNNISIPYTQIDIHNIK